MTLKVSSGNFNRVLHKKSVIEFAPFAVERGSQQIAVAVGFPDGDAGVFVRIAQRDVVAARHRDEGGDIEGLVEFMLHDPSLGSRVADRQDIGVRLRKCVRDLVQHRVQGPVPVETE